MIEKRHIVPIAAMVSAGKSKLLNVIFNIDFLECKAGIGTKFVNILRYNPKIDKPKFYHLIIKKELDNKGTEINVFYKDPNYEEKVGEIPIIEENKNINDFLSASPKIDYDNIFYMTEINKAEFIQDKEYLLTHDLCDIPGLSEYQTTTNEDGTNIKKKNNIQIKNNILKNNQKNNPNKSISKGNYGYYFKKKNDKEINDNVTPSETPDKEEDDFFYQISTENEQSYLTEIFGLIKDYIDGAIIVLSVQNYYFLDNFEIITKLRKVINKEFNNFLIILNKIDLSEDPKADLDNCIGLFLKYFPKCKTFNFNLNTFIPISAINLQNELLMTKSYTHLLKYHFYNYISSIKKSKQSNKASFIDHLKDIIINLTGITKDKIEEKVEILNNLEENKIVENDIKTVLRELKDKYKADNYNFGITEEEVSNVDENDDDFEIEDSDKTLKPVYILKMIYLLFKEKKLIPPISEETKKLLNYFSNSKVIETNNTIENNENNNYIAQLNDEIITQLKIFCKEIQKSATGNEKFKNLTDEIIKVIKFLKIYDTILIPFLGPSNSGKSTIINSIIGKDILPSSLKECTKRGILIGYIDSDNIYLHKADFKEEIFLGKTNYWFKVGNLICQGEEKVKQTLEGLNYDFNDKEEDSFYFLQTKIKLFDEMGIDESTKRMIYLIDFPGYGTGNVFEKEIYNKVMSICNSFLFVVRNTVIKEKNSRTVLKQIFQQAKEQKKKFASQFIKSCLFVFNNDEEQKTSQDELNKAKEDIKILISKDIEDEDINLCFFNAKFYHNYCNNYNFFFNLQDTINKQYKKYLEDKYSVFVWPNDKHIKPDNSFHDYFYDILYTKVKADFDQKITNKEIIENEVEKIIRPNLNQIKEYENLNISTQKEKKILQLLSFARRNIKTLKTLEESNVEEFKNVFNKQIKYINDNKQLELKEQIDGVISSLDMYFKRDFSERKKDLKKISIFESKIKDIKFEFNALLSSNENEIKSIVENYKKNVTNSLKAKKSDLDKLLENKDYTEILGEINKEIKSNLKGLDEIIKNFIDKNNSQSKTILTRAREIIYEFAGKYAFEIKENLKEFISKKLGNKKKSLEKEVFNEIIDSCESLGEIFSQKGFKDWFLSLFSNISYLENIIDMVIDSFKSKIDYNLNLIKEKAKIYLNNYFHSIDNWISIVTLEFNDEELKRWKDLCQSYDKTREKIFKVESILK